MTREGYDQLQVSSKRTTEQLHSKTQLLLKHEEVSIVMYVLHCLV